MKNKTCVNCVYYNTGWCELKGITPYPPDKTDCENFKPKPITNGDRIRSMSDEELAELLVYEQVVIKNIEMNDAYSSNTDGSCTTMWKSALLPTKYFDDKQKAIEATLSELKKRGER